MSSRVARTPASAPGREAVQIGFVIAWSLCVVFYLMQYPLRSAPSVMMSELSAAFARDLVGVSALVGLYYYSYSLFSIVVGAALDRLGGEAVIPGGIVLVAAGAILFGLGNVETAQIGRLLQGERLGVRVYRCHVPGHGRLRRAAVGHLQPFDRAPWSLGFIRSLIDSDVVADAMADRRRGRLHTHKRPCWGTVASVPGPG